MPSRPRPRLHLACALLSLLSLLTCGLIACGGEGGGVNLDENNPYSGDGNGSGADSSVGGFFDGASADGAAASEGGVVGGDGGGANLCAQACANLITCPEFADEFVSLDECTRGCEEADLSTTCLQCITPSASCLEGITACEAACDDGGSTTESPPIDGTDASSDASSDGGFDSGTDGFDGSIDGFDGGFDSGTDGFDGGFDGSTDGAVDGGFEGTALCGEVCANLLMCPELADQGATLEECMLGCEGSVLPQDCMLCLADNTSCALGLAACDAACGGGVAPAP